MHTVVLGMFEYWLPWPTVVRSSLALVLLVVLGALIYRYVERPCGSLRRRLSSYLKPAKEPAHAPTAEPERHYVASAAQRASHPWGRRPEAHVGPLRRDRYR